jgi:glycosyltransferase involved in cell wall biosynthesis
MIICMVTPHLPPDQAANALLPALLRDGLVARGHEVRSMAFEPKVGGSGSGSGSGRGHGRGDEDASRSIHYVPRPANGFRRKLRISHVETGLDVWKGARRLFRDADVVHIHSNTFMNQVAAAIAHRRSVPFVLTHYGTEIWHYRPRAIDAFRWMNERASHVTYYSRLLLDRSVELGITPEHRSVVYPPVSERFRPPSSQERTRARGELGLRGPLLLNVKRLHPLAGQRFLIEAMPSVLRSFPEAKLAIAGEGDARSELEALIDERGLRGSVQLLGLVDNRDLPRYYHAADLFVLPSRLEAFPTVAAEALASGLRVVSADHPGGIELEHLFPDDVKVVPRERAAPLSEAIVAALASGARATARTLERIENEFRPASAIERYLELYQEAADAHAHARIHARARGDAGAND